LALGYSAVIISAATFAADYKLGWDKTKHWTAAAVVAYFILNSAFTYWTYFVEKGTVFVGDWQGKRLTLSSKTEKHSPVYHLTAHITSSSGSRLAPEVQVSAPFSKWFTSDGVFAAKPFQQWLASAVPVVGEADPNNIVEEIGRGSEAESSQGLRLEDVLRFSGAEAGNAGNAGKARKRG